MLFSSLPLLRGRPIPSQSAYYRLFQESHAKDETAEALASLLSKAHAATIVNGSMLERNYLQNPDYNRNPLTKKWDSGRIVEMLHREGVNHYTGFRILPAHTSDVNISRKSSYAIHPDYISITPYQITVYEVKDGDTFDSKKSRAEVENLIAIRDIFERAGRASGRQRSVLTCLTLWNCNCASDSSFRSSDSSVLVITGRDMCEQIGIDYDRVCRDRMRYGSSNKKHILQEMRRIIDRFDAGPLE